MLRCYHFSSRSLSRSKLRGSKFNALPKYRSFRKCNFKSRRLSVFLCLQFIQRSALLSNAIIFRRFHPSHLVHLSSGAQNSTHCLNTDHLENVLLKADVCRFFYVCNLYSVLRCYHFSPFSS